MYINMTSLPFLHELFNQDLREGIFRDIFILVNKKAE